MRNRPIGAVVAAVVFAIWALDSWVQVALWLAHSSDDPGLLALLHVAIGAAGAWAAVAAWRRSRPVWLAAILTGALTAGMLAALPRLISLPREATRGLLSAGAVILLVAIGLAWLARRRAGADATPVPR